MEIRDRFQRIGRLIHQLRRVTQDSSYAINEELYWNQYAKDWEESGRNRQFQYVGSEWKHEEAFLSLLQQYASPEKEALEIGCGGGRITATGVQLFKQVYAADISDAMLRKCGEAITASNLSFHRLDGFTLKNFSAGSIDFVYSHDVFVQLSSLQVYPYLKEIERVLKVKGIGLISFYDFVDHFKSFTETSLRLWHQRKLPVYRRLHFVTEEMLRVMLGESGFEVLEVRKDRFLLAVFRKV
jgi:ubiquinone/menaquinone biosynthesis C-methylase UbiE